jgi:hypothetical protein
VLSGLLGCDERAQRRVQHRCGWECRDLCRCDVRSRSHAVNKAFDVTDVDTVLVGDAIKRPGRVSP